MHTELTALFLLPPQMFFEDDMTTSIYNEVSAYNGTKQQRKYFIPAEYLQETHPGCIQAL